jgi:hypothetical protein
LREQRLKLLTFGVDVMNFKFSVSWSGSFAGTFPVLSVLRIDAGCCFSLLRARIMSARLLCISVSLYGPTIYQQNKLGLDFAIPHERDVSNSMKAKSNRNAVGIFTEHIEIHRNMPKHTETPET